MRQRRSCSVTEPEYYSTYTRFPKTKGIVRFHSSGLPANGSKRHVFPLARGFQARRVFGRQKFLSGLSSSSVNPFSDRHSLQWAGTTIAARDSLQPVCLPPP